MGIVAGHYHGNGFQFVDALSDGCCLEDGQVETADVSLGEVDEVVAGVDAAAFQFADHPLLQTELGAEFAKEELHVFHGASFFTTPLSESGATRVEWDLTDDLPLTT